ncbi:MAG: hypothetical protein NTZ83_06370 [Candidatus Pacearchaeota archaeon]|nr:hypothetical protein [Candidatus Pacearchaeota archaeon]
MKKQLKPKEKVNWRVVVYSLMALGFLALTYLVDWIFITGAVILIWLNQREIMGKKER